MAAPRWDNSESGAVDTNYKNQLAVLIDALVLSGSGGTVYTASDGININGSNEISCTYQTGSKNRFINPYFDVWQRGTSFTADGYAADRWGFEEGSGASTVSRQSHTLGNSTHKYFYRHNRTSAAAAATKVIYQRIKGVESFQGENVAIQVYGLAGAAKTFRINYVQHFGTTGSPSSDVTGTPQSVSITTSAAFTEYTFSIPSITGKTLGTDGNDYLEIYIEEASGFGTFTLDIYAMQIEPGTVGTNLEQTTAEAELQKCLPYYWEPDSTLRFTASPIFNSTSNLWRTVTIPFPAQMVQTPTVTATLTGWSPGSGGVTKDGIQYKTSTGVAATTESYVAALKVDAEL